MAKSQKLIRTIFGTADRLILHRDRAHVDLADFKFGRTAVDGAEINVQMQAYALAAMDRFKWADTITIHVIIPRRDEVSTATFTRAEAMPFRSRIRLIAERAQSDGLDLNPNTEACRFCGRRIQCPALAEKLLPIAKKYEASTDDFELAVWDKMDPAEVTDPATLGKMKRVGAVLERWRKAVDARALELAVEEGAQIPGFDLIYRNPTIKVSDASAAFEALNGALSPEQFQSACNIGLPALTRAYANATGDTLKDSRAKVELAFVEAGLLPSDDDRERSPVLRVNQKL